MSIKLGKFWRFAGLMMIGILALALLFGYGYSGNTGGSPSGGSDGDPDATDETVYKLSMATYDPITSNQTIIHQEWADLIHEASGGRVEITIYAGGSLSSSTETLDAVKTGAADIGWIYTSFYPGQFALTDVVSLPLSGIESAPQATEVLWGLYEYSPEMQAELAAYKLLMMYTNPSSFISTAPKPVRTLEDLKGLKLRAPAGTATDMMIAWGGTPIAMGPGDIYQSVEKGVLDGFILEYTGIKSFRLNEVANYYSEIFFFVGPFLTLMNNNSFNALPEDLQAIIEAESGYATSMQLATAFQSDGEAVRESIIAEGGQIIEISGAALEGFGAAASDYAANWVKTHTSSSFDAQAYLDKMYELVAQRK